MSRSQRTVGGKRKWRGKSLWLEPTLEHVHTRPHADRPRVKRRTWICEKKKRQGNEDQIIEAFNGRPSRIRSSPSEQQTCEQAILGGFHPPAPPPPLTTLPHLWPRPDEHYLLPSFSLATLSLRLLPLSTSCLPWRFIHHWAVSPPRFPVRPDTRRQ